MPALTRALREADDGIAQAYVRCADQFGEKNAKWLVDGLIRFAFLIEPVKENINTTKFTARWIAQPSADIGFAVFSTEDPRFASYLACREMFDALVEQALESDEDSLLVAWQMRDVHPVPYELPIDYKHDTANRLHAADNVEFIWNIDEVRRATDLRLAFVLGATEVLALRTDAPTQSLLKRTFDSKVAIKAHLTDRAQTGANKTNREKRWEVLPSGPQYAYRRECISVEYKLLRQICGFEGFPALAQQSVVNAGLLAAHEIPARCPITLDPILFEEFTAAIRHPVQGRSGYHVGHITPLKVEERGPTERLHTGENISWISEVGNRIQSNLSVEEAIALIRHIAENWARDDAQVQAIALKEAATRD